MLTPAELKNALSLIEVGAKTISSDRPLAESVSIQQIALGLCRQLVAACEPTPQPVPQPDIPPVSRPEEEAKS
jgi:hypothetical protein